MKKAYMKDGQVLLRFTHDPKTRGRVRSLPPPRRWVPEKRAWTCPATVDNLRRLKGWGFSLSPLLTARLERGMRKETIQPIPSKSVPGLTTKMFPYQEHGVGFLEARNGRALLADEMGLGKTLQTLAWLQLRSADVLPAVVICPASLKGNWERETLRHTSLWTRVLEGTKPAPPEPGGDVLIINYDILPAWLPFLEGMIKSVVLDECHFIKNTKARRSKAVRALCKGKRHVIAISGTPIVNRPFEFFTTLNLLAPDEFPRYLDYVQRYCDPKVRRFKLDLTGASHTDELFSRISGKVMLRRTKDEVLDQLPEKTCAVLPLSVEEKLMNEYRLIVKETLTRLGGDEASWGLAGVAHVAKLQLAAVAIKMWDCLEWIETFLETGRKLVVFVIHHVTTDLLQKHLGDRCLVLDGRVPVPRRQKIVDDFQRDGGPQVLIGNVQVAGAGFTITVPSEALFMELPWTPGELVQAEDRLHRIGQKNAVTIYYAITRSTIEENMIRLLEAKKHILDAVLDGAPVRSQNILTEVVRELREERLIKKKGRK